MSEPDGRLSAAILALIADIRAEWRALDRRIGEQFRDAALAAVDAAGMDAGDIAGIGSHGQTIRHQPLAEPPYSLQIGNPDIIATGTGITTVADFRSADIAAGHSI